LQYLFNKTEQSLKDKKSVTKHTFACQLLVAVFITCTEKKISLKSRLDNLIYKQKYYNLPKIYYLILI